MKAVLLSTWALFFGFAFTILSIGLQGPLVAVRAFDEGFDTSNTGLIMAGLSVGYLAGALVAPRMIRHVGHAKVFAASASIASGTVLLFASFVDPVIWFFLRVATGFCLAAIFIVTEAWLNQSSPNEARGKILNLYIMLGCFGWGAGALLLNLSDPQGFELFILASVLISFGIVPILLSAKPAPAFEAPKRLGLLPLYRRAPLGVGAIFMAGLSVGTLIGAGPIFADKSGFTTAELSVFMAVIFLGSQIFLWPIGALADRFERSKVLIAAAVLAALVALLLSATSVDLEIVIFLLIGLLSGLCFSLYPICSAITNDNLDLDEVVGAGTALYSCNSVGQVLGPVISTEIIEYWRPSGFFLFLAAVQVLTVIYAIAVMARRPRLPAPRRRPMESMAYRSGYWITPGWREGESEPEQVVDQSSSDAAKRLPAVRANDGS